MKLKTLQENPALFCDVRDMVVELAKYHPVPEAPPLLQAGLGGLKWKRLENPSEEKPELPEA